MIKAGNRDKPLVVDILSKTFDRNTSVNFVVKQDKNRPARIRKLMEYSFDLCHLFGEVYLSEDRKACALTLLPDKKKTTLNTLTLDLKLAFNCIGIPRVLKVLRRESAIKTHYPSTPILYLWFIGVIPTEQGKGIGRRLLSQIVAEAQVKDRPIYLETSMPENLNFYKKEGLEVYKELVKPHKLFLIRNYY